MAQIHATADAVVATARALLALADDPSEVEFTHGPEGGAMFIVSDALADKLVAASDEDEAKDKAPVSTQAPVELEKPDAPTVTAPPAATTKLNPRAKVSKE